MAWGEAHKPSPLSEVEQIRDRMRIEIAGRDAEIERLLKQLMAETTEIDELRTNVAEWRAIAAELWAHLVMIDTNPHGRDGRCRTPADYMGDDRLKSLADTLDGSLRVVE